MAQVTRDFDKLNEPPSRKEPKGEKETTPMQPSNSRAASLSLSQLDFRSLVEKEGRWGDRWVFLFVFIFDGKESISRERASSLLFHPL